MTRNAAALVIGIDRYDDVDIPTLSGSVHDAKIAVAWLRKIGVAPERIHLHVSPAPDPRDIPDVRLNAATFDSIMASLETLAKETGDQLFLFFSGHGLNVPGALGGPIFLAQDYGSGVASSLKNMRMHGLIQWMLSWRFRDQFLFYDACQNPSTSIGRVSLVKAVDPPMLDALPVAVTSGMLACFSASPGQKAWASNGQGVLMRLVLDQLDPDMLAGLPADAQQQDAILYDWATGARQLDLRRLFADIIAPAVIEEAAEAGVAQAPASLTFGTAASSAASPILDLPPERSCDVSIKLMPVEVTPAIKQLRLSIQTPARTHYVPVGGADLPNPFLCKAPSSAEIVASCTPKPGTPWRAVDSPQKATIGDQPVVITLNLDTAPPASPPGPPDGYNIRVSGPDGSPQYPLGGAYEGIAEKSNLSFDMPAGLTFEHHEYGVDIGFDTGTAGAPEMARSTARDWYGAIRRHLSGQDLSVLLLPPGVDPNGQAPNIEFRLADGGAIGLAGFLGDEPAVSMIPIDDGIPSRRLSLSGIEAHPAEWFAPGTYRLAVDVPWGRWSQLIVVPETGERLVCALPGKLGREPLRNAWARSTGDTDPPAPDVSTTRRLAPGLPGLVALLARRAGDDDRVEPFSRTRLPEWDELFSAARLDLVGADRIRQLASEPPSDLRRQEHALLMLGLGHAALQRDDYEALRVALAAIDGPLRRSVDYALLANLLRAHDGKADAEAQASNIMRHVRAQDRGLGPAIILGWSAPLLSMLFAKARSTPPLWLSRLAGNSVLAVRTRADAHREDEAPATDRSVPAAADPAPPPSRRTARSVTPEAESGVYEAFREERRARRGRQADTAEEAPQEQRYGETEGEMEA